jgi:hypothetical protein
MGVESPAIPKGRFPADQSQGVPDVEWPHTGFIYCSPGRTAPAIGIRMGTVEEDPGRNDHLIRGLQTPVSVRGQS